MMAKLIRYDAAVVAIAKAERVDEVMRIRNQAEAVRVYAQLAKPTLKNYAYVAGNLQSSRRRDDLTFKAHSEVCGLPTRCYSDNNGG